LTVSETAGEIIIEKIYTSPSGTQFQRKQCIMSYAKLMPLESFNLMAL
jgi:hypothetical protein